MHPVDIQDRNGAATVPPTLRARQPWPRYIFSDGDYAGDKLRTALADLGRWTFEQAVCSATAWAFIAHIRILTRQLARA